MPDRLNGLFFSEILADNAGSGALDLNGQDGANKQDEYIEFQNNTNSAIDLNGYQLWSEKNGLLHSFGVGDQIAAGGTTTVAGTYASPPAGFYDANGNNNAASGSGGFLEDGEGSKNDTIFLVDPDGNYIQLSYGSPATPPSGLPSGFPTGGTLQGAGEVVSTGAPNGVAVLRDADGNLLEGTPTPGTPGPFCFALGTLIATDQGNVAVETLEPGMRVLTKCHGFTPLRGIRGTSIGRMALRCDPELRSVVVPSGVLGNELPLRLSPAHRVLFTGPSVELLFGEAEVLAPIRQLIGYGGIYVDRSDKPVTYFHLLFDEHEIVQSNGCWSESFYLGDRSADRREAKSSWLMQTGVDLEDLHHDQSARLVLKRHEAALLSETLDSNLNRGLLAA